MITRGDVQYEGSIEIPADLMAAVDLWPGEKVLVASVTSGNRLETYALQGPAGTGNIIMNGGAAHLIKTGERVVIMSLPCRTSPSFPRKSFATSITKSFPRLYKPSEFTHTPRVHEPFFSKFT